ncbi:MAG TPA: hypothetical protein VL173_15730 [Vicinamibacterales bacterium]|nr:hypothetical protein [Vicinamibacterales bacterium]
MVPPESTKLFVAVGVDGGRPAAEPPEGVESVQLLGPDGESHPALVPEANIYGRMIFVIDNPRPGRWRAVVRHAKNSRFVIRATAMTEHAIEAIKARWPRWRCTGCKEGFQGAVAAAASCAAGMLVGMTLPAALTIGGLAAHFRVPERVMDYIIKRVSDVSLDRLIEEVCEQMEMCPA